MSDSEIDMNKKSPIESCIAHEELEQKHKSIEDSQSMQDKEQLEHKTEATQTPSNTSSKTKTKKLDNDLPPNSIAKRDLPTPTEPSEPPPLFDEEPPSGPEVYFFESDHAALKHNAEWVALLSDVKQSLDRIWSPLWRVVFLKSWRMACYEISR